jgi:orotate phosphoribosyltransferase
MPDLSAAAFIDLVAGRRGHFAMESGYHSALWLDLDALFASSRVQPFVSALADELRRHRVSVVCGPMVGGAFLAQRLAPLLDAEFWYTEPVAPAEGQGLFRARYRLPAAFVDRLARPRVAIVDDVMSAGSSLRATYVELSAHGARVVAVGSLLTLGNVGAAYFTDLGLAVESVARADLEMWTPAECPHCAAGVAIERVAGPRA